MGIFSMVDRRSSLSNPDRWLIRMMNGDKSAAGVEVDEDRALSHTAVLAGVRLIAETYGSVPIKYYQRTAEGKVEVRNHPTWFLLHEQPNDEQTCMECWEMIAGFAVLSGTGYGEIIRDGNGRGVECWPIPTHRVKPERDASQYLWYRVTDPKGGPDTLIPHDDMFALRGFSRDGVAGLNTVETSKESLGLALALDRYAASYIGNDAQPAGILSTDRAYKKEARQNILESWQERHGGAGKKGRVALLQEGMKWIQTALDPEKSQLLPQRKFSISEVARILNLPPHMLKDLERATFSNIEHQSLEFVTYSMRPWFVRGAQALERVLILPSQRGRFFIEHVIEALLVGDIKARYDAYAVAKQNGWLNGNEIRAKENMNAFEGGDEYTVQVNMIPVRMLAKLYEPEPDPEDPPPADGGDEDRSLAATAVERACGHLFRDAAARIIRAEAGAVRKALRKSNGGRDQVALRSQLDTFAEEHRLFVARALIPAVQTYVELAGGKDAEAASQRHAVRAEAAGAGARLAELRGLIGASDPDELEDVLSRTLEEWERDRPASVAAHEIDAARALVQAENQGRAA
jgi:HK97 family phage portal protein